MGGGVVPYVVLCIHCYSKFGNGGSSVVESTTAR